MKFLNGMWLVKEGVEILRAKEAYEIFSKGDRLEITAPTSRIENRGVTLNLPVISIELSSPRNDVIRIKMVHHAGTKKRGPHFQISEQKSRYIHFGEGRPGDLYIREYFRSCFKGLSPYH